MTIFTHYYRIFCTLSLVGVAVFLTSFVGIEPEQCKPIDWVTAWLCVLVFATFAALGFAAGRESKQ